MSYQQDTEIVINGLKIVAARDGEIKSLLDHTRWSPGEHHGPVLVLGPEGTYLSGISLDLWLAIVLATDALISRGWNRVPCSRFVHSYRSTLHSWFPSQCWWHFYGYDPAKLARFVLSMLPVEKMANS